MKITRILLFLLMFPLACEEAPPVCRGEVPDQKVLRAAFAHDQRLALMFGLLDAPRFCPATASQRSVGNDTSNTGER